MKSAVILAGLSSTEGIDGVASKLDAFIGNVAMENRAIRFNRLIASYFSAARYSEIRRGILMKFNSLNYSITSTYDYLSAKEGEKLKTITMPIFDNAEYSLAERLFGMFTKNEYLLSNPAKLGKTIAALRKGRHRLDDVFGMQFNTTSLRTLRLYALLHDYGESRKITKEALWSLYFKPYAYGKFFGLEKERIAEKAMVEIAKATEKTPFLDV